MITYLMLDKDDITVSHGEITSQELRKEMSSKEIFKMVNYGRLYKGKYILVEDDPKVKPKEDFDTKRICDGKRGTYYATKNGDFYIVYKKSGLKRQLKSWEKKNRRGGSDMCVKISDKDRLCKNLIAETFIKEYKTGDTVLLKDRNIKNCSLQNLEVVPKDIHARKTGAMSNSKSVGLYENGKLVRKWSSARKAALDLYCSRQTITDACNNKHKTKLYDVRWI